MRSKSYFNIIIISSLFLLLSSAAWENTLQLKNQLEEKDNVYFFSVSLINAGARPVVINTHTLHLNLIYSIPVSEFGKKIIQKYNYSTLSIYIKNKKSYQTKPLRCALSPISPSIRQVQPHDFITLEKGQSFKYKLNFSDCILGLATQFGQKSIKDLELTSVYDYSSKQNSDLNKKLWMGSISSKPISLDSYEWRRAVRIFETRSNKIKSLHFH